MRRVQFEIVLGTILVFLSTAIIIYLGFKEENRLEEYKAEQVAEQIEFGAAVFEANCTRCHGSRAQGIAGLAPCLRCEELFTTRLDDVGWEGDLQSYIISVVSVGRQVSTRPQLYVGGGTPAMPTWSEKYNGPLRDDQIRAVAAYIMNFEPYALGEVPTPEPLFGLVDESDPLSRGRAYMAQYGCTGCHAISGFSQGDVGPVLDGIATRAETRIEGYTAEEYIHESIIKPYAYIVEGYQSGVDEAGNPISAMPNTFSEEIPEDQLNDIIAFLMTLTEE